MAFKVGEKCVFVSTYNSKSEGCIEPCENTIHVISGIYNGDIEAYSLEGFEKTLRGTKQWFRACTLRKLDYNFVEEVIKQVTHKEVEA